MALSEITRLQGELGKSHKGPAWHGPSVLETLDGVDFSKAQKRAGPEVHTIWEIVKHVTAWQQVATDVLLGEEYRSLRDDEDWPPVTGGQASDWEADLGRLKVVNETLLKTLASFPEAKLDYQVPGREYSFYVVLHGIAQHNIYHAGQIAMLKKLLP
ncbi:hypothetical protein F183_A48010 [Bryobacterales bacterium F-183]|nr:hypothetical protein F183_A48010 [Bryobacterales bacterium F-183]